MLLLLLPGTQVSLVMTLCAVFTLSPFLADLFDPPLWIAVTTSFVMENQSASAITTSLLRLVGTVLVSGTHAGAHTM